MIDKGQKPSEKFNQPPKAPEPYSYADSNQILKLDKGNMPFVCTLCKAPFNQIDNCRSHIKREHKGFSSQWV